MSCSTVVSEYGWPTFVRICERTRSRLTFWGPTYWTSIERITMPVCARETVLPDSTRTRATKRESAQRQNDLGTCVIKIWVSREKPVRGGFVLDEEEQGTRKGRI